MPAGVHNVDLAVVRRAKSTLSTYTVHFVDLTNEIVVKSFRTLTTSISHTSRAPRS